MHDTLEKKKKKNGVLNYTIPFFIASKAHIRC